MGAARARHPGRHKLQHSSNHKKVCKNSSGSSPPKPQQTHANLLLRLMDAEFSDIYFPCPAVAPRTKMISMKNTCVARDYLFCKSGIVEHLDAVPKKNNSVVIVMHGHDGLTSNTQSWARLASCFDSLSIYITCCIQANQGFESACRIVPMTPLNDDWV